MGMMRAAVVGCGLIGGKRAEAVKGSEDVRLTVCCDVDEARARTLARTVPGAEVSTDWKATVGRSDVDLVFVATVHDMLAPIAAAAAGAGKHVLVEKPGARCGNEIAAVREAARKSGALVRVGFNHRYHPALRKARQIFESGALGQMMFVRGRYGHGGRPGYDREWRAAPEKSGGGELVDQGMHLIDLARWFLGDFGEVKGFIGTYFWNMPVEDNAFLLLRTARRAGRLPARHLDGMEEPVFTGDLRARRQTGDLRPGRQLRRGAAGFLPHATGDGTAGNHHLGVSRGGPFLAPGSGGLR